MFYLSLLRKKNMNENEKVFPPSKYIKDALTERGWSQADFAAILGRNPAEISAYLAKDRISIEFSKELSVVFGNTPEFWLGLENKFRLFNAPEVSESIIKRSELFKSFPLKDMQKRGWISDSEKMEHLEPELTKFFEIDDSENDFESKVSFKRTIKEANLNAAEKAWLYRAKHLARALSVAEYDEDNVDKLIDQLRKFSAKSKAVVRVPELLASFGLRYVVVEPLPKAKIDGAAFWLDEISPVVAMSLRFDNIGSFYFALLHEIIHIKHKDHFSFDDLESSPTDVNEVRANEEAADSLVPKKRLENFIKMYSPFYSEARINNLATQLKVHPGIIVGQLQHRKEVGHNAHQKIMAKVRELVTTTAFTDGWGHPVPQVRF
jgi:HTH-type transcriptional regulator/antitoxin HigA